MLAGIEDGSLIGYDSFFNDPSGVPRSLYTTIGWKTAGR